MAVWTRRGLLASGAGLALAGASSCAGLPGASGGASSAAWAEADAIRRRIRPPAIPKRDLAISAFGAKPESDCTGAIAAAIAAANAAGGGRVIVPPGVWQ